MNDDPTIRRRVPAHLSHSLAAAALISVLCALVPVAAEEVATAGDSPRNITLLEQQVRAAETAFAASFAAGDMDAFAGFLDDDAVFTGGSTPLRGKTAIVERWTRLRGTGEAPFTWRPERVAVEARGDLGMSTGPVLAPDGRWISSFVSTWRKTDQGWRVVLDVGPRCPPPAPAADE